VTPDKDLYGVLGVSPSVSQEQIRLQYRVLVRKYHPDLHPGDASAALMMERVNAAYDVLGNPEERRQYNAEISASSQSRGETAAGSSYGQSAHGSPAGGTRPQSTWNPQWGNTAADPRERQAEAEAMWEAMRSQERGTERLGRGWACYLAHRSYRLRYPVYRAAPAEHESGRS